MADRSSSLRSYTESITKACGQDSLALNKFHVKETVTPNRAQTGWADSSLLEVTGTDLIYGTAVYVIRKHGGVGGRGREASSYPD